MGRTKYRVAPANERQYLGRTFGSKAEREYCQQLELEVGMGEINSYVCQPRIWLGVPENVYIPDFLIIPFHRDEWPYYIDVKGVETAKFKRDKKLWVKYARLDLHVVKKKGTRFVTTEIVRGTP
jgi:hypothetical protein